MKVMDLLERVTRERSSAIVAVTHDMRMIARFESLYPTCPLDAAR